MALIETPTTTATTTATPTPTATTTATPTTTPTATATCIFVLHRALLYDAKGFDSGGRYIQIVGQCLSVFPRLIRERARFVNNGRVR